MKKKKIDNEDFDFFVENQKRDLRVFVDSQPAQSQERTEKLTLHILEIAATKVVPILIAMIWALWLLAKRIPAFRAKCFGSARRLRIALASIAQIPESDARTRAHSESFAK